MHYDLISAFGRGSGGVGSRGVEARNKRNPPTSVVGGMVLHPYIVRVNHESMDIKGRLLLPGGTAFFIASGLGMSTTLLSDADIRSRLS